MPLFGRDNDKTDQPPAADPRAASRAAVADHLAQRTERMQVLVDQTEALIAATAELVRTDGDLARMYRDWTVQPWATEILAAHGEFRDEILTNLPALREATHLVQRNEGRLAVRNYGPLLARLRDAEARLGDLKKAKPDGIARVSINQTARCARRPSHTAETLLSILLEGQAKRTALGEVQVNDVTSRLVVEGVDARDVQVHLGTSVVYVWNHPAVIAAVPVEVPA